MPQDITTNALLDQLDAEWTRLREALAGKDEALLAQRPPSGKWSVRENVRHLVFAELAHLTGLVPGRDQDWRAASLPPHNLRVNMREKMVGTAAASVREALEVWQPLHVTIRAALAEQDTGEVRYRLGRHIKHQQQHVDEVARLLRQAQRKGVATP